MLKRKTINRKLVRYFLLAIFCLGTTFLVPTFVSKASAGPKIYDGADEHGGCGRMAGNIRDQGNSILQNWNINRVTGNSNYSGWSPDMLEVFGSNELCASGWTFKFMLFPNTNAPTTGTFSNGTLKYTGLLGSATQSSKFTSWVCQSAGNSDNVCSIRNMPKCGTYSKEYVTPSAARLYTDFQTLTTDEPAQCAPGDIVQGSVWYDTLDDTTGDSADLARHWKCGSSAINNDIFTRSCITEPFGSGSGGHLGQSCVHDAGYPADQSEFDSYVGTGTSPRVALQNDYSNNHQPSCSVDLKVAGDCGSASGQPFTSLSSTSPNLCSPGSVEDFDGTGPWTWGCQGPNGGTKDTTCHAEKSKTSITYTITPSAEAGCNIDPSTDQTVESGGYRHFTSSAPYQTNYTYEGFEVDGVMWYTNGWDFTDIKANHTIKAHCNLISTSLPTCQISANPTSITSNGSSTITWSTDGTSFTTKKGTNTAISRTPASGGTFTEQLTSTTTYYGTATGTGGTKTCDVTVTVTTTPPPNPTLWHCDNSTSCSATTSYATQDACQQNEGVFCFTDQSTCGYYASSQCPVSNPTYWYCSSSTGCSSTNSYADQQSCTDAMGHSCFTDQSTCNYYASTLCPIVPQLYYWCPAGRYSPNACSSDYYNSAADCNSANGVSTCSTTSCSCPAQQKKTYYWCPAGRYSPAACSSGSYYDANTCSNENGGATCTTSGCSCPACTEDPQVSFWANPSAGTTPVTANFNFSFGADVTSITKLDFGDNSTPVTDPQQLSVGSASHTYTTTTYQRSYIATLFYQTRCGAPSSKQVTINVSPPPSCSLTSLQLQNKTDSGSPVSTITINTSKEIGLIGRGSNISYVGANNFETRTFSSIDVNNFDYSGYGWYEPQDKLVSAQEIYSSLIDANPEATYKPTMIGYCVDPSTGNSYQSSPNALQVTVITKPTPTIGCEIAPGRGEAPLVTFVRPTFTGFSTIPSTTSFTFNSQASATDPTTGKLLPNPNPTGLLGTTLTFTYMLPGNYSSPLPQLFLPVKPPSYTGSQYIPCSPVKVVPKGSGRSEEQRPN